MLVVTCLFHLFFTLQSEGYLILIIVSAYMIHAQTRGHSRPTYVQLLHVFR